MTARILLVRDGDMPAATVERVLARDYAMIEVAEDWAAAHGALAGEAFDLAVFGDSGDGAMAADCIRILRRDPDHEALPIILAAQLLTAESAAAAYAAGADAVIGPHPDTVLLGARLRHMLRHQTLLDELRLRREASRTLGIAVVDIDTAPIPRRLLVLTDDGRLAPELGAALDRAGFALTTGIARPIVQVVGRFHSDFGGGLIQALRTLRPAVRVTTLSIVDARSSALHPEDRDRADFVVYVGPRPEAPRR